MQSLIRGLALLLLAPAAVLPVPALAQPAPAEGRLHATPQRGDYLPAQVLRAGPNVDPAAARLRRPPSGYAWFQLRGVYALASLQTGLIVEVVTP